MRKKIIITILAGFTLHCNNVGFVEKAKAVANGEFGFLVISMSGVQKATNFLGPGTPFYSSCSSFTGVERANCDCQAEASSRPQKGTFRAWLSISGQVDAICNIQGSISTGCTADSNLGPFLTNSSTGYTVLASNYAELSSTGFRSAVESTAGILFSGTKIDGRASGQDCSGFTDSVSTAAVTAGERSMSGTSFTTGQPAFCNLTVGYFLCMRQSK